MTQYIPERLIERAFYQADLDLDENLRRNYSGRGMYGRECFGITHSHQGQLMSFLLHLDRIVQEDAPDYEVDFDLAFELTDGASSDSMAFDTITYFPGFLVGNNPDSQEDDEDEDED